MKRSEAIGEEYIRHKKRMTDIDIFFDFIESTRLIERREFRLPHSGGDFVKSVSIDYDNLVIKYMFNYKEVADQFDIFELSIDDIKGER